MTAPRVDVDERNSQYWDELCGTTLARSVGVKDSSEASLARFDAAFLTMYPYLDRYLPSDPSGERLFEIGLGYGTVGGLLAQRGADYHGLDIAAGPVAMMRHRLDLLGVPGSADRVQQGSALAIPHADESFDRVVSIGCLHHTGDVRAGVREVARILRPGGTALVMVYNRRSVRQFVLGLRRRRPDQIRASYDIDSRGEAAPVTEFVGRREVPELFAAFCDVSVSVENFDEIQLLKGHLRLPRAWFLGNLGRLAGLDLYVTAVK